MKQRRRERGPAAPAALREPNFPPRSAAAPGGNSGTSAPLRARGEAGPSRPRPPQPGGRPRPLLRFPSPLMTFP